MSESLFLSHQELTIVIFVWIFKHFLAIQTMYKIVLSLSITYLFAKIVSPISSNRVG